MERDRNLATGDYVVGADGKPVLTDSLGPPCRARIRGHRGQWMYAPNNKWGSDMYRYVRKSSIRLTDVLGESTVERALQPMVDNGRIDTLEVTTQFAQRGGTAIHVHFLDRKKQVSLPLTIPVGL